MKKLYLSLVALLLVLVMMPTVSAKNKVTVYMFTKNGCGYCEQAFDFFEGKLKEDPDAFELVNLEVWCGTDYTNKNEWILGSQKGLDLMKAILEAKGKDSEGLSTPTIVVGDYIQVGADNLDGLYDRIVAYQDDKNYKDELKALADEKGIDMNEFTREHGAASCDVLPEEEKTSKTDLIIIAGVFVVLIGGFVGLIFISKK